jgi:replication initiation protein RepC
VTGARRMSLTMLVARDQADGFRGLPRGTAKPLRFLAAFQEAEPYLGLPIHAFKLVSWLVKQTQGQDWEEGSRPIAWPSARRQAEFLGLSLGRVKALNRALFEAGVFVIRDNEQGKRYGRRDTAGRIIEAYGFDLSPLAVRFDEFIRVAAEARVERDRMKALRRRVTLARRAIRQAGETLAGLGPTPEAWPRLQAETADLVAAAKGVERSDELAQLVAALERRKVEAEQWLKDTAKPVETDPEGLVCEPHITSTNLTQNPSDTVIAREESSRAERAERKSQAAPPPLPSASVGSATPASPEKLLRLKAAQLLDLAPCLGRYVLTENASWREIVDAAGSWLRPELGVSPSLWGEACRIMGREYAAIALALVSTKDKGHFTSSAGGYFAGMVRKAELGELHLERTLWALREAKWGKADKRRVN